MTPRSSTRRKTRYLSLRRRLAAVASVAPMVDTHSSPSPTSDHAQLTLFPLHPDTALNDHHDDHLSRFFPGDDAVTLHSLLGPPSAAADNSSSTATTPLSEDPRSPSSSSANYSACSSSYGNGSAVVGGLARAALRGRERWWAEEEEGEAASGGVAAYLLSGASRRLSLKLDYQGILSAWSDKGPLFVEGEALQVVPDVHNTAPCLQYATPVFVDVAGYGSGGGGLWTVPDGRGGGGAAAGEGEEGCGGRAAREEGEEKMVAEREDREARVMRYKEKRRHRLFSKRIRYEVRKLNAEKRPRVKGRFVRRDDEE